MEYFSGLKSTLWIIACLAGAHSVEVLTNSEDQFGSILRERLEEKVVRRNVRLKSGGAQNSETSRSKRSSYNSPSPENYDALGFISGSGIGELTDHHATSTLIGDLFNESETTVSDTVFPTRLTATTTTTTTTQAILTTTLAPVASLSTTVTTATSVTKTTKSRDEAEGAIVSLPLRATRRQLVDRGEVADIVHGVLKNLGFQNNTISEHEYQQLSTGAIIGIAIGSVIVLFGAAGCAFRCYKNGCSIRCSCCRICNCCN